jgi:thiamine pyrophosphate-dependent acetolactate synthase large subunit-like protein
MKTVADQFAETLAAAGVRRICGIVGDVGPTLKALLPLLEENRTARTSSRRRNTIARPARSLDDLAVGTPGERPIHPQQVAKAISDQAAADAVLPAMSVSRQCWQPAIWR